MSALTDIVAAELAQPVDPRVTAFAADIAARHDGAAAVLFYGSCLREAQLDGLMLDFYLIVDNYRRAYEKAWLARANAAIPPNVFHAEHRGLVAKYAVLSRKDFARQCAGDTRSVSVWARFAQPSRLVWAADDKSGIIKDVAAAPATLLREARPMMPMRLSIADLWQRAFALTYDAELRAERKTRAGSLFDAHTDWYRALTAPALAAAEIQANVDDNQVAFTVPADINTGERAWAAWRRNGKLISIARLAKATATFDGGIDYLAWKINRHAGTSMEITPWQRRHPILAGIYLLPKLIRGGAVG
ncbi:MAG: hypothetical protein WA906_07790 [Pacificimonas sp.]